MMRGNAMRMTVLSAGPASPHAGWVAIDELAQLLAQYFQAQCLSPATLSDTPLRRLVGRARPRFAPLEVEGGDVLFVVAREPGDLAMVQAIADVRRKFSKIHAFVTDSYFTAGYGDATALFDSITVTAHEDVAYPMARYGIVVHQLYQGIDGMRWAPPRQPHCRDIDLIAYGRTPKSYHDLLAEHFHSPQSPYLYLHSPLGHLRGPTVARERGMLFKLLHRSHVSLAFHLFVEPDTDRPRSMMVTSRWLESLLSGCLVAGRRPVSRMADEMLNWSGATVELPENPALVVESVESLLAQREGYAQQRITNSVQTLLQHDWRWRMVQLCQLNGWDVPAALTQDLVQLRAMADGLLGGAISTGA